MVNRSLLRMHVLCGTGMLPVHQNLWVLSTVTPVRKHMCMDGLPVLISMSRYVPPHRSNAPVFLCPLWYAHCIIACPSFFNEVKLIWRPLHMRMCSTRQYRFTARTPAPDTARPLLLVRTGTLQWTRSDPPDWEVVSYCMAVFGIVASSSHLSDTSAAGMLPAAARAVQGPFVLPRSPTEPFTAPYDLHYLVKVRSCMCAHVSVAVVGVGVRTRGSDA